MLNARGLPTLYFSNHPTKAGRSDIIAIHMQDADELALCIKTFLKHRGFVDRKSAKKVHIFAYGVAAWWNLKLSSYL